MRRQCPNLTALAEKRPELLATATMPDGHIYGLPGISEMGYIDDDGTYIGIGAIPQFTSINKDWLEKVGMEMPTTLDELHDVLVAFKENDCNGNGDATDEDSDVLYGKQLVCWNDNIVCRIWFYRL